MKKIAITAFIATIMLCMSFCSSPNNANKDKVTNADTIITTASDNALATFRESLSTEGFACAVAYIGTILDDSSTELGFLAKYSNDYSFVNDITEDDIVRNKGDEVYLVIPAKGYDTAVVSTFVIDESNDYKGAAGNELRSFNEAKPFVLRGNISEIMPNIIITLSGTDGEMSYYPCLSGRDGRLSRYDNENKVKDISIYDFAFEPEEE